jgi:hypothetical protein
VANNFSQEKFFGEFTLPYFCSPNQKKWGENAEVAQLVERNLAKVEVAGSSLVFRSKSSTHGGIFYLRN